MQRILALSAILQYVTLGWATTKTSLKTRSTDIANGCRSGDPDKTVVTEKWLIEQTPSLCC